MLRPRLVSIPPLLILLFGGTGCGEQGASTPSENPPVIVTSIFPIGDLTRILVGDLARVEVLLPPGASPATFDITPRQLQDLSAASLFVMIGGGLDEWVARLPADAGGEAPILRLSEGIPLLAGGGHEGEGNPHVWLDPLLVRDRLLPPLRDALAGILPGSEVVVEANARALADSLTALDAEIRVSLEPLVRRSFVATHAAWSYFAARYGLDEAGVIHAHPGAEPSGREIAELMEIAAQRDIHCVFIEPQIGEVAARALATELSIPTCMLDPLGGAAWPGRDGYFQLLRFNVQQFLLGLQKEPR